MKRVKVRDLKPGMRIKRLTGDLTIKLITIHENTSFIGFSNNDFMCWHPDYSVLVYEQLLFATDSTPNPWPTH